MEAKGILSLLFFRLQLVSEHAPLFCLSVQSRMCCITPPKEELLTHAIAINTNKGAL